MSRPARVLFLCTGNACRSQMAEGWARHLLAGVVEPLSAGVLPHGLDPRAVRVMAERGVDISGQRSKSVSEFLETELDLLVTVCDHARETCPVLPVRVAKLHAGFEDPPSLAALASTEEEALAPYRRIRDEIRDFVVSLPSKLENATNRPGGQG